MKCKSRQQIFNSIVDHLLCQTCRSLDDQNRCAMRGIDRCLDPLGYILTKGRQYHPDLEKFSYLGRYCHRRFYLMDREVHFIQSFKRCGVDLTNKETFLMMRRLQDLHDYLEPEYWFAGLQILADELGLQWEYSREAFERHVEILKLEHDNKIEHFFMDGIELSAYESNVIRTNCEELCYG